MTPGSYELGRSTSRLLRDVAPILLVPLGSTEQHGPHLPLDTDTRIATAVAAALTTGLQPDALLAPTDRLLKVSRGQSVLKKLDEHPYILASWPVTKGARRVARILIVSRIDSYYLSHKLGMALEPSSVMALLAGEVSRVADRIVATSAPDRVPLGTRLTEFNRLVHLLFYSAAYLIYQLVIQITDAFQRLFADGDRVSSFPVLFFFLCHIIIRIPS